MKFKVSCALHYRLTAPITLILSFRARASVDQAGAGETLRISPFTPNELIVTGVSAHPRGIRPVSGTCIGEAAVYQGLTAAVKIEKLTEESSALV